MAEENTESSSINYQKTVSAQKERTTNVEKPKGWTDKLTGKYVHADVESYFNSDRGGTVNTRIHSGDASLHQNWKFDRDGNLTTVSIIRGLHNSGDVSETVLERSEGGTFQVKKHKISGGGLRLWEQEFQTANKRLK